MCVGAGYLCQGGAEGGDHAGTGQGGEEQGATFPRLRDCDIQKEKCREAAKMRRSKENEYFKELESLLQDPTQIQETEETHVDKISILRLSIVFLRTRSVVESGLFTTSEELFPAVDILPCLDGFIIVLSPVGDIIFVSDNVTRFIGLSKVDILGHPFSCYVHPGDQHQLQLLVQQNGEEGDHVEILVRVKCTVTERGRMVNLKQASYVSLKISGKTLHTEANSPGQHFLGLARVLRPGKPDRQAGVFSTKHGVDMRIIEADSGLCQVAGYSSTNLVGKSYYDLVHPQDSKMVQEAFASLFIRGVCETGPYRLLCGGGGEVWVQTIAMVRSKRGNQGQGVVCRHNQISDVFDRGSLLSLNQLDSQKRLESHQLKSSYDLFSRRKNENLLNKPSNQVTEKGVQLPIKSPIPIIIERRQKSAEESNNHDKTVNGCNKFITSALFKTSNYQSLEALDNTVENRTSKPTEDFANILHDDTEFFKKLEESLQIKDLVQLSPHCGEEDFLFAQGYGGQQAGDITGVLDRPGQEKGLLGKDLDSAWLSLLGSQDNIMNVQDETFVDSENNTKTAEWQGLRPASSNMGNTQDHSEAFTSVSPSEGRKRDLLAECCADQTCKRKKVHLPTQGTDWMKEFAKKSL